MFRHVSAFSLGTFSWRNKRKCYGMHFMRDIRRVIECYFLCAQRKNQKPVPSNAEVKGRAAVEKTPRPEVRQRVGGKQFLDFCSPRNCSPLPRFPPNLRANSGACSAFFPRPGDTLPTGNSRVDGASVLSLCLRAETRASPEKAPSDMRSGICPCRSPERN